MKRLIALVAIGLGILAFSACDLLQQAEDALADAGITLDDGGIRLPDGGYVEFPDSGVPVPDGGPEVCNVIPNVGPDVQVMHSSNTLPTPQGGAIANGVYVLTAKTQYDGEDRPDDDHLKRVFEITDGVVQGVMRDDGDADIHLTATLVTNGAAIQVNVTCPMPAPIPIDHYTATATELRLYEISNGKNYEEVYTLQGAQAQCSAMDNTASPSEEYNRAGEAPAPQGGAIVPGTYYRTATNQYGQSAPGPTGTTYRTTIDIESVGAGAFTAKVIDQENLDAPDRFDLAFTTIATQFVAGGTCGPMTGQTKSWGYTADSTSIKLYDGEEETVFTLQQP